MNEGQGDACCTTPVVCIFLVNSSSLMHYYYIVVFVVIVEVSSCYHCFLTICARSSVSIIPQSSLNALCKFVLSKRLHIDKIRKEDTVY